MPCGMLEAAMTPQWLLTAGSEATKRAATPVLQVAPLPALISIHLKTLVMVFVNFTTTMPTRLTGAFRPVLGQKTN